MYLFFPKNKIVILRREKSGEQILVQIHTQDKYQSSCHLVMCKLSPRVSSLLYLYYRVDSGGKKKKLIYNDIFLAATCKLIRLYRIIYDGLINQRTDKKL